ncbi:hypothetical protein [Cyanobium sp. LEGE 06113]|uniref:hypothetical protein n=1 Tax=Cyanobium sp. LEGE 06113 TaxID=1297573 RepID=UPI0018814981|nr:hypothetical protein [Cyanobium sp. LEGE 06113]MBE9153337.1 hypothetical protein [Cyanobium sp. LEGE 06113]
MDSSGDQPIPPSAGAVGAGRSESSEREVRERVDRTLAQLEALQAQGSGNDQQIDALLEQALKRISALLALMRQSLVGLEGVSDDERSLAVSSLDGAEALISLAGSSRDGSLPRPDDPGARLQYGLSGLDLLQSGWRQLLVSSTSPRSWQPGMLPDEVIQRLAMESRLLRSLQVQRHQQPAYREALHQLSIAAYRCRYLLKGCRQSLMQELLLLAMQLEDIAKGLRTDSGDHIQFWSGRLDQVEDRLEWVGFKQRRPWLPVLNVQKLVRRVRTLQRQESVQGRMLAGLGVSLTISVLFLLATTTATTVLGALSAINTANRQAELIGNYQDLTVEVKRLLDINNQNRDIDASLEALQPSIELAKKPLLVEPEQAEQPAAQQPGVEKQQQNIRVLENLNRERNLVLGEKAEKDREFSRAISRLTLLYEDITTTESRPLQPAEQGLPDNPAESNWYGVWIDTLAGPLQDPVLLKHSRRLAIAAFAGALGSIMSILIRLDHVDEQNVRNPFVVGALKPVIGAVFGIVIFMVLTTNVIDFMPANFRLHDHTVQSMDASASGPASLAAGVDPLGDLDSQELYKIFLVAFIAGFSERLAGDTLRSVGRR